MRKLFIILLFIISVSPLFSQNDTSRFNLKFGSGFTFHGTGDMYALTFENEVNYRISRYISLSASVNYGKSDFGVFINSSFIQGNANIFFSPFKNTGKHNLKISFSINPLQTTIW